MIDLTTMSDTAVWGLIEDRLGMEHDWSNLYTGDNVTVLRSVLTAHIVDLNLQFSEQNAHMDVLHEDCLSEGVEGKRRFFQERAEHRAWKASATYFKRLMERRLAEVRRLDDIHRRSLHAQNESERAQQSRDLIRRLAVAIAGHQDATSRDGGPSKADLELWMVLDRERVPVGGREASLTEMLATTWFDADPTDGETSASTGE